MRSEVCSYRNHDVMIKSAILIFFNGEGYTGGVEAGVSRARVGLEAKGGSQQT